MLRRAFRLLLFVAILVMVVFGVVAQSQQLAPDKDQVVRIAFDAQDLQTLDPHFANSTNDRAICDMVFNGLLRYKPGDIKIIEPDLAESWEVSSDMRVWIFHLRHGVMVHPWDGHAGYELTSEDVVYSFLKASNGERSAYAGQYTGWKFEAVDPYTVKISFSAPMPEGLVKVKLTDYAGGFILPKKPVEEMGDMWARTHPVGTGPFIFKSYTPMSDVVLTRNENYFRGKPYLREIVIRYIANVNSRNAGLQSGDLDIIDGAPEKPWIDGWKGVTGVDVLSFGPGERVGLYFNMSIPPFNDIRLRYAVAYAIDRDELRRAIGEAIAAPLYTTVPELLPGGPTREEVQVMGLLFEVDRERAKELLAQAGYPDGITINVTEDEKGENRLPALNIQDQLRKVGINLKYTWVDHATGDTLKKQDIDPILTYVAWRPTADIVFDNFWHSDAIVAIGKKPNDNFSHYMASDDLIVSARQKLDAEKQALLWENISLRILADMAEYPLYMKGFVCAKASYVDMGYELQSTVALYSQINELTSILAH